MKKTIALYNLLLATIISLVGITNAKNPTHLVISLLFLPIAAYFSIQLFKRPQSPSINMQTPKTPPHSRKRFGMTHPSKSSHKTSATPDTPNLVEPEILSDVDQQHALNRLGVADANRRIFLKFIGTSSLSLFILALFTKRAQAAFFGSNPGPGIVAIKDSSGNTIDPAEKQPTDGYEVAEIDDTGTVTYYGFVHKNGSWYITQESDTGSYRYHKGAANFSTSWALRSTLSYDTFDNVF